MAIIAREKIVSKWLGGPPYPLREQASPFYFSIPSYLLSEPYYLKDGDRIKGEILAVKSGYKDFPELSGKRIELLLYSVLGDNNLFISKRDWEENFREYGLVTSFILSVRLDKAVKEGGEEVSLYTKGDVEA